MGATWGRQEPGGPHVGPMNFAIWDAPVDTLSQIVVISGSRNVVNP